MFTLEEIHLLAYLEHISSLNRMVGTDTLSLLVRGSIPFKPSTKCKVFFNYEFSYKYYSYPFSQAT